MKKICFLLCSFLTLVLAGCDRYLDVKPKGFTIPEFFDDYAKLMSNQDLIRVSSAYPSYLTDDVRAGDSVDVSKGAGYNNLAQFKKNLYTFNNGPVFLPGETDPLWEPAYAHIYTYNTVINNILNVPDATAADRRRLRAEALVGRAFEYLVLVNAYARHYDVATAATDLGVPLVLSEDINAGYKRNSVAEVYEQIQKDLEEALPDLSTTVPHNFRPLKSVGYAFLSRMHLYMGNYEEALRNANEALKLNSYLTDYNLYTTKEGVTFGRVCEIADNTIRFPDANLSQESIWIKFGSASSSSLVIEVYASDDLLDTYEADLPAGSTDKRLSLFFCRDRAKFGAREIQFPGRVLWAPYVEFNLGLSSPELYLIAAECEARVGDRNIAIRHINTLRDHRINQNQPLTAATNEEALAIVLRERRREMPYIGCTRLIDLKRLNRDARFAKTITHTHGNSTFTLPAEDKRYILPVPPKVTEYNSSIPQYER